MKILLLTQFFDPEPASIPGLPLASWLARRGHEVQVLTGFPNYPGGQFYPGYPLRPFRRETIDGVLLSRIMLYPSHDRSPVCRFANYASFALSASVLGFLLTERADAVYVYHPPATVGLPAILLKRMRDQPFIYHVQDMWPESVVTSGMLRSKSVQERAERMISWWCRQIYRHAACVIAMSPGMRRLLLERGVPSEKIAVIPNWAEEEVFHPVPRDEALAREIGLDGHFNIVYSGNLGLFQGLETAIRAARRVRHLPNFQLVFVGTGQMEPDLRRLVDDLALDNVRFIGRQPYRRMNPITGLADVLLVSLQDRPFFAATIPSKTQVAMACGRPLLMAVRGDAADLVRAAGAGITCPPGDDEALAGAFEHLFNLPRQELAAMGNSGHSYYQEKLSLERGAGHIEALLESAAVNSKRPQRSGIFRNQAPARGH